jgi:DNA-binding response OmpR family regulator
MHILVVEDEPQMAAFIRQYLEEEGHHVAVASTGGSAVELAAAARFDLIVLDIMLPGIDGFEVARRLRRDRNQTPMLMLTARDADEDVIRGLDLGADDYLTKPFSFDVFLARVRAVARRGPIPAAVCLHIADLEIDTATREVRRGGRVLNLTPKEYGLLEFMARSSPRVLSRNTLIEAVWGFDGDVSTNNLEAFIHHLRAKLEHSGETRLIRTVRGVGYALHAEETP